jgi:streptomycin 6-kinase
MPDPHAFGPHVTVFRRLGGTADERAWLGALPDRVRRLEQMWRVQTGRPYEGGSSSWVAPGTTTDGTPVVLKVVWPHREARGESIGLRLWSGHGAPVLYAAEPSLYALLMERCDPGLPLSQAPMSADEGLRVASGLLRELWLAPPSDHGLEHLADVGAEWAITVRSRQTSFRPPFDPGLVELGAQLLASLPASATEEVVLHGDANPTNFLSATRRPWLLIDSKPMVGDPGYDVAPLALQLGDPLDGPRPTDILRRRYEVLEELLGIPFGRLVAWSVARGVESALWEASTDDVTAGADEMATVAVLAALLEC